MKRSNDVDLSCCFTRLTDELSKQSLQVLRVLSEIDERLMPELCREFRKKVPDCPLQIRIKTNGQGGIDGLKWGVPNKELKGTRWIDSFDARTITACANKYKEHKPDFMLFEKRRAKMWELRKQIVNRWFKRAWYILKDYPGDDSPLLQTIVAESCPPDLFVDKFHDLIRGTLRVALDLAHLEHDMAQLVDDVRASLPEDSGFLPRLDHSKEHRPPYLRWGAHESKIDDHIAAGLPTHVEGGWPTVREMRKLHFPKRMQEVVSANKNRWKELFAERTRLVEILKRVRHSFRCIISKRDVPEEDDTLEGRKPSAWTDGRPATDAQKRALAELGVNIPEKLGLRSARDLIAHANRTHANEKRRQDKASGATTEPNNQGRTGETDAHNPERES